MCLLARGARRWEESERQRQLQRRRPNLEKIQQAQGACCLFTLGLLQCVAFLVTCVITLIALISFDPSIGYSWLCIWLLQGQLCVLYVCAFKLLNIYTIVGTMVDAMLLSVVEVVVASAIATADFPPECRESGCTSLGGTILQRGSVAFGLLFLGIYHFLQAIGLICVTVTIGRLLVKIPKRENIVDADAEKQSSSKSRSRSRSRSRRSKSKSKSKSGSRSHKKSSKSKSTKSSRTRKARSAPCTSEASRESCERVLKSKSKTINPRKASRRVRKPSKKSFNMAASNVSTESKLYTMPSTFDARPSLMDVQNDPPISCPMSASTTNGTVYYSDVALPYRPRPAPTDSLVVTMPSHIVEGQISRIVINIPPPLNPQTTPSQTPADFIPESKIVPRRKPIILTEEDHPAFKNWDHPLSRPPWCFWQPQTPPKPPKWDFSPEYIKALDDATEASYKKKALQLYMQMHRPDDVAKRSKSSNQSSSSSSKIAESPFDSAFNIDLDVISDNKSIILPSSICHSPGTNVVAAQSIFTANKPRET